MALKIKQYSNNFIPQPTQNNWRQPDRDRIVIDETHALMTLETFNDLQDYPEKWHWNRFVGKMCRDKGTFYWYGLHKDPHMVSLHYRRILIIH